MRSSTILIALLMLCASLTQAQTVAEISIQNDSGTSVEAPHSRGVLVVPDQPGLYTQINGSWRHIIGRPTNFSRTGSRLASGLTAGIHASRMNTQIAGESAYVTVSPS